MQTIEQVMSIWPSTKMEEWRKINDAWVHQDCKVGEKAEIKSGTIEGGTIWGGTIWGGTIWGGTIWGGTWRYSPLQIQGSKFLCYHAGPGLAGIGCQVHPIEEWFSDGFALRIARNNDADFAALEAEYRLYMELIRKRDAQLFPPDKAEM